MKKLSYSLIALSLILPVFVFAVTKTYTPLVPIPGVNTVSTAVDLGKYLGGLYKILIAITIILAVIVVTFAGIQNMTSESPFDKSEAKKRIGQAIGGIIIALVSWLILFTINPDLVSFKFITNAPQNTGSTATPTSPPSINLAASIRSPLGLTWNYDGLVRLGTPPYTIQVSGLPPGLTFNPSGTGSITGVTTAAGTYNVSVQATDGEGRSVQKTVQVEIVEPSSLLVEPSSVFDQNKRVGDSFIYTPRIIGAVDPVTFTILLNPLPPGLTLNSSTGQISGTLTTPGTYHFVLRVKDSRVVRPGVLETDTEDVNIQIRVQ